MDAWFLSTSSCLGSWHGTQPLQPKNIVVPRCILGASEFTLAFSQYNIGGEKVID